MIAKARTGVDFFDERYGGAYRGRSLLVTGKSGSGKSILALQFLVQGLKQGERCLLLSGRPAADVVLYGHALNLPLSEAVESGHLIVLEYNDYVPGRSEALLTIPPDGFVQLQEIIQSNGVQRVALDTCLPWVTAASPANLAEHVFSFVRAFDRLATTTLLTLPKPVSPIAYRLKSVLEDTVPIAITLQLESEERRLWLVTKYLGEARLDDGTEFVIAAGIGLRRAPPVMAPVDSEVAEKTAPAPLSGPHALKPEPTSSELPVAVPPSSSSLRVRFSKVVLGPKASLGDASTPSASATVSEKASSPDDQRSFRSGSTALR